MNRARSSGIMVVMLVAAAAFAGNASALVGGDVTIYDENSSAGGYGAWPGGYASQAEDQEVEPGSLTGQQWDTEGFFYDKTDYTLTLVGGWNFQNGYSGVFSGDIFIDTNGDAQFGNEAHAGTQYAPGAVVADSFNYEYVIDVDWLSGNYAVYSTLGAMMETNGMVTESINWEANPLRRVAGGTALGVTGTATYSTATDAETGFVGGSHNTAAFDLDWLVALLPEDSQATFHFTESCGNDYMMGFTSLRDDTPPPPSPEPASLVLLGAGVLALAYRHRKGLVSVD